MIDDCFGVLWQIKRRMHSPKKSAYHLPRPLFIATVVLMVMALLACLSHYSEFLAKNFYYAIAGPVARLYLDSQLPRFGAEAPLISFFHVVSSGLMLSLVPLQFSERFRLKWRKSHRALGMVFVALGYVSALTAFLLGFFIPYSGRPETIAVFFTVTFYLFFLTRAVRRAIKNQRLGHRKDMMRALALALGIASQRIIFSMVHWFFPQANPQNAFFWTAIIAFYGNWAVLEIYWWSKKQKRPQTEELRRAA